MPMFLSFQENFDFGFFMLYLRIPPIAITAILIIILTIYIFIKNSKINTMANIKTSVFYYNDDDFSIIMQGKNIFKKNIIKLSYKYEKRVKNSTNQKELIKIAEDIQGWFISKDKFSWMWFKNKQKTHNFYKKIFDNICFKIKNNLQ